MTAPRPLEVPLPADGVLRLRAVGPATLALGLAPGTLDLTRSPGRLRLAGTSTGLPASVKCTITCTRDTGAEQAVAGTLVTKADGTCSLDVTLPLLLGGGSLRLKVRPERLYAPEVAVKEPIAFSFPCQVKAGRSGALRIGDPVPFTATRDPRLAGVALRVQVVEKDAPGKASAGQDLDVTLDVPAGGATWRVGCDAAGHPDYAEASEDDDAYEFAYRVLASADGWKTAQEAAGWADLCTAPRPALKAFRLDLDASARGHDLARDAAASQRAKVRRSNGGPEVGHRFVYARGGIAGLAADLPLQVGVTLWRHRPWDPEGSAAVVGPQPLAVTPKKLGAWADLRTMAPVRPRVVAPLAADGTFEVPLLDGAALTDAEVADLAPPAALFAVLDLPGWTARGHALRRVLAYDPARFAPFGDGDLPRPGKDQKDVDVAVAACTEGTALGGVALGPAFLPLTIRAEASALVVGTKLRGADAKYWKAAAPRLEAQVGGQGAFTRVDAGLAKDGVTLEARLAMPTWAGHGKAVTFRARVDAPAATFRGERTTPPGAATLALACTPAVTGVTTALAPSPKGDGGQVLVVRAATRYVPSDKGLVVTLASAGAPLAGAKVAHAPKGGAEGLVGPDGVLAATATLDAAALAAVKAGTVSVTVSRAAEGGKLHGLAVQGLTAPVRPS